MDPRSKLSATALVRMDDRLRDFLEVESRARGCSVSFLIREALLNVYGARLKELDEVMTLMGSQMPIVVPEPSQGPSEGGPKS